MPLLLKSHLLFFCRYCPLDSASLSQWSWSLHILCDLFFLWKLPPSIDSMSASLLPGIFQCEAMHWMTVFYVACGSVFTAVTRSFSSLFGGELGGQDDDIVCGWSVVVTTGACWLLSIWQQTDNVSSIVNVLQQSRLYTKLNVSDWRHVSCISQSNTRSLLAES